MTHLELQKAIADFIEAHLPDENHFLVNVTVKPARVGAKVTILADADEGITIEACASMSRQLNAWLEEGNHFEGAYTVEVSSPGTDFPLNTPRMFRKNIGRELKVVLKTGDTFVGPLTAVEITGIVLSVKKKEKGKKQTTETMTIGFEQIAKAVVQVSFK
ncbi:MAG: ribosome maturation factor RimP [Flexibacteraceae bacterium]